MSSQTVPFPLRTVSYSTGGRDQIDLSVIPPTMGGHVTHIKEITFEINATPTLSSGSLTADQFNAIVRSLLIRDGVRELFNGSFRSMRLFEALEEGTLFTPESTGIATTLTGTNQRTYSASVRVMAQEGDFFMPAAAFRGGTMEFGFESLTTINANLTALTATIQPVVHLALYDDVRLPPLLERREGSLSNAVPISQESQYLFLGLANSNAFGAFTTGGLANIDVHSNGIDTQPVHSSVLTKAYHQAMRVPGGLSVVQGDPRSANDINAAAILGSTLAASSQVLQPVIWSPWGSRIGKVLYEAKPTLMVRWSGTNTSAYFLATRLIPRDTGRAASYVSLIQNALGAALGDGKIRTLGKWSYKGPDAPYLPISYKVKR